MPSILASKRSEPKASVAPALHAKPLPSPSLTKLKRLLVCDRWLGMSFLMATICLLAHLLSCFFYLIGNAREE